MSWQKVKLGQFLKNRKGRYKPKDPAIQGLKRIEKIDFSGTIYLSDKVSNTDMILVKKGDLVISGINVEKGAMNIYQGEEDVVATIHYSSYEFDEKQIDIDFLTNFLKSLEFKKALKEQVPGGIKTEIKPKHILPLEVEIPTDIEEQRKVVKKLNENNSIIEDVSSELTHQLDLIKQLRQAFLREAMQGKLLTPVTSSGVEKQETGHDLLAKIKAEKAQLIAEKKLKKEKELPPITNDEIPFEIPEHWAWCRLGEISNFISGTNFNSSDFKKGEGVKCIKITNAGVGELIETDDVLPYNFIEKYSNYIVYQGDLILALTRPYIAEGLKISKCNNVYNNSLLNQRVALIRNYPAISNEYIYKYLRSDYVLNKYKSMFEGKGQQPNLKKEDVTELLFPLPPLHEQEQIVAKLAELMAFCDGLEQSIKESQGYNEKLLQQVLREALQPQ
ncbi:restriction endonuclease subunit S [uncultured Flavobacterium sp.]|uniref:restriction endonuclease subunit S n=1 Tax=uncultured Flavobacterium sp. TaxID=165435 RepID=UPI0026340FD9|nr:restriction endonuclease subunit S [uncultured Flavobacterium sp.]